MTHGSSIISQALWEKKGVFHPNIQEVENYNLALDNPFKIDIKNQIVLPIIEDDKVKGIVRFSQLPLSFSRFDYLNLRLLMPIFKKLFRHTFHERKEDAENIDSIKVFKLIYGIRSLFSSLSESSNNPEVAKLIIDGEENIATILTYLNPNTDKVAIIKKELLSMTCSDGEEKKVQFNVLIADDIKINVRILNAMLSSDKDIDKINYAYDGLETLEVIQQCDDCEEGIHILFLDHHMPGLLGTEIAHKLRTEEDLNQKNIIIVSITNDPEAIEKYKDLYNYHLPKPFTRQNIETIMSKIRLKNE